MIFMNLNYFLLYCYFISLFVLHDFSLRLGVASQQTEDQLLKLDEQGLTNHYKVGIMYCKAGQASEEEMYNNEEAGPAFHEFLDVIGQRVRLKGFDKYRAGLDNKSM
jgi:signal-induced proliferation-associated 1 like protein 1